ncbi:hypothetical protein OXB_1494 [Bacillus sp. OxB-1]|uniref:beta family protein n=1 Tax=Bacillus sp. (strain OxB-1) TaxID=98228 RepID=UPI000581DF3A|nr:beta family protein [Bacillus sp. OxB-1]BAQ09965.1 hypothetical protein OXB_1494 [Bacillus sp. OxB-1]
MFTESHYVPAIKWKRGERIALENLSTEQLERITPLIEIQPIQYDHKKKRFKKTIDQHLHQIGKELSTFWSQNRPVFVDAHTLFDDSRIDQEITLNNGQSPLEFISDDIESNNITAIPVTSILRYPSYHDAVEICLERYKRGLALRLEKSDLENFDEFQKILADWLSSYKISPKDVDLILDFKEIDPAGGSLLLDEISLLITKFPYLNEWRTFTILSTSMTPNLSHLKTGSNSEIPRVEWEIYTNLLKRGLSRFPAYGDYNISSPEWFDFDPTVMNIGANLKYTVDDRFLIFRGRGVRQHGFSQFRKLCTDAINHSEFCGQTFSFGDDYIYKCATDSKCSTGNSETWVRVCVNHHLAFVISRLANVPVNATV